MWIHRRSGQMQQVRSQDHRDAYERDRTRVIHCPAFRRMQGKTQILGTGEGDFHRTRLTHSLEVASIGVSITRNLATSPMGEMLLALLPSDDLISTICLLHDMGHPPFGHSGEAALNYMMRDYGGFEGNGQTLRLVLKVDDSYGEFGLDLTRRTLLGILKYPVAYTSVLACNLLYNQSSSLSQRINDWLPPKGYFATEQPEIDWLLAPFSLSDRELLQALAFAPTDVLHGSAAYHSLDCSIMDIADDIAYGVHDLEDAIHLQLIQRQWLDTPIFRTLMDATPLAAKACQLLDNLFAAKSSARKHAIGELVNYFITSVYLEPVNAAFENQLLAYHAVLKPEARDLLAYCIQTIYKQVIDSPRARAFEHGGQMVLKRLFEAISTNPASLLSNSTRKLYAEATSECEAMRVVCDYIACMTDEYAHRLHERLFGLNIRTVSDR